MGATHDSRFFEVSRDTELGKSEHLTDEAYIDYKLLIVNVPDNQHSNVCDSSGFASALVTDSTPLDYDLQCLLEEQNDEMQDLYRHGYTLCSVVPLFPSHLCSSESRLRLQGMFLMLFSSESKSADPKQSWSWQLVRTELNTRVITDCETLIVGSQKLIINEVQNDPLLQTISHGTANGGRLVVANAVCNYCKQSQRAFSSVCLPIDVIFETPQNVCSESFAYNLQRVVLYQELIESDLDNASAIRLNCEWPDLLRKSLEAGWSLVDIACDSGDLVSEPCTIWFFERKTADTLRGDPCCEGRVIECMVNFDRCLDSNFKNFIDSVLNSLNVLGRDGWKFACAVYPDRVADESTKSVSRRVIAFFQRRLRSSPNLPSDYVDMKFAPPSYTANNNDSTLPPSYDEATLLRPR